MEVYQGKLISADFEESTMEFEIQHDFTVKKGDYVIIPKADYQKLTDLIKECRDLIVMCTLIDKSGQCKSLSDKIDKEFGEDFNKRKKPQ